MNKEEVWDKAKLQEWKKFWESEMGQEAIKKIVAIKEDYTNKSMTSSDPNWIAACIGRAAGVELVLQMIETGLVALNNEKGDTAKE